VADARLAGARRLFGAVESRPAEPGLSAELAGAPRSCPDAAVAVLGAAPAARRADGEPARLPDSAPETDPAPEPAAPGEPTSSANATGIAATAEPTPNATANAPTRPTYRT